MDAQDIKFSNAVNQIRENKEMFGGSYQPVSKETFFVENGIMKKEQRSFSEMIVKMFNELIDNCCDHAIRSAKSSKPVRSISIDIRDTNVIIRNDGAGIPIFLAEDGKYSVEKIYTEAFSGSNLSDKAKKQPDIYSGTNGIGVKLVTYNAEYMTVTTVRDRQRFEQTYRDRCRIVEPAVVASTTLTDYTQIEYQPAVGIFGENDPALIKGIFEMRAVQVQEYLPNVSVRFCGEPVQKITKYWPGMEFISTVAKYNGPLKETTFDLAMLDWKLYICVLNDDTISTTTESSCGNRAKGKQAMSIVNGVNIVGGNHINYVYKQILEHIQNSSAGKKLAKMASKQITEAFIAKNTVLIMSIAVPNASWVGNEKSKLRIDLKNIHVTIPPAFMKKIAVDVISLSTPEGKKRRTIMFEKYTHAKNASKPGKATYLLLPEGDSAKGFANTGISEVLGVDNYGILTLSGVIISAYDNITVTRDNGKKVKVEVKDKFMKNAFVNAFLNVTGLDIHRTYENTNSLYYRYVVLLTDQDVDGLGNICTLFMSFIFLVWPELYDLGFVKRMATPLIKAIPKSNTGTVLNFYDQAEFEAAGDLTANYNIRYFKGLAGNTKDATIAYFKRFNESLYTYSRTDKCAEAFVVYMGDDSNLRKSALSIPLERLSEAERAQRASNKVDCYSHLHHETKEFQLDRLNRSIPDLFDGLNEVRRKILAAMIKFYRSHTSPELIYKLGGIVAKEMHYHHGDMSLNKSITTMGMSWQQRIPYLLGIGQIGTYKEGGKDVGQPRYVSAVLNKPIVNLLFPKADEIMYKYVISDGDIAEPQYYVPILPMVLLENYDGIAAGWSCKIWARSLRSVVLVVKAMIAGNMIMSKWQLPYCPMFNHGAKFVTVGKKMYTIGAWSQDGNQVNIRALPLGVNNRIFRKKIFIKPKDKKESKGKIDFKPDVVDYFDESSERFGTNITITTVGEVDPIKRFGLLESVDENINVLEYVKSSKVVRTKATVQYILQRWFAERSELFDQRYARLSRLLEIKIQYWNDWLIVARDLDISKLEEIDAERVLTAAGLRRYNSKLLNKPPLDVELILTESPTFDYAFDITNRDRLKKGIKACIDRIAALQEELDAICPEFIRQRWLADIDRMVEIIHEGQSREWKMDAALNY